MRGGDPKIRVGRGNKNSVAPKNPVKRHWIRGREGPKSEHHSAEEDTLTHKRLKPKNVNKRNEGTVFLPSKEKNVETIKQFRKIAPNVKAALAK